MALAVDVSAILVMPKTVQKMIGFWDSDECQNQNPCCISYENSVLEVVDKIQEACQNPESYVKGLFEWKKMMWESNLKVFGALL